MVDTGADPEKVEGGVRDRAGKNMNMLINIHSFIKIDYILIVVMRYQYVTRYYQYVTRY